MHRSNNYQDKNEASYAQEHCIWCWAHRHPDVLFPDNWSSTICPACKQQVKAKLVARKSQRMPNHISTPPALRSA